MKMCWMNQLARRVDDFLTTEPQSEFLLMLVLWFHRSAGENHLRINSNVFPDNYTRWHLLKSTYNFRLSYYFWILMPVTVTYASMFSRIFIVPLLKYVYFFSDINISHVIILQSQLERSPHVNGLFSSSFDSEFTYVGLHDIEKDIA